MGAQKGKLERDATFIVASRDSCMAFWSYEWADLYLRDFR